jgi:hypothetical protein
MYTGPTDGLTRWFTSLGYHYDPSDHGMASDWALDLVSLGFAKPQQVARPEHNEPQVKNCPWGVSWAARAIALALEHARDQPSTTGARPIGELLWRCSTKGVY